MFFFLSFFDTLPQQDLQLTMSSYILYRQSKVATLKQHDMTAEMISQIFQVGKFKKKKYLHI